MKHQYEVEGLRWRIHGVIRFINIGGGAREQVYAGLALSTGLCPSNMILLTIKGFTLSHTTVCRKCIYRETIDFEILSLLGSPDLNNIVFFQCL